MSPSSAAAFGSGDKAIVAAAQSGTGASGAGGKECLHLGQTTVPDRDDWGTAISLRWAARSRELAFASSGLLTGRQGGRGKSILHDGWRGREAKPP
jgi:hypothetical protein